MTIRDCSCHRPHTSQCECMQIFSNSNRSCPSLSECFSSCLKPNDTNEDGCQIFSWCKSCLKSDDQDSKICQIPTICSSCLKSSDPDSKRCQICTGWISCLKSEDEESGRLCNCFEWDDTDSDRCCKPCCSCCLDDPDSELRQCHFFSGCPTIPKPECNCPHCDCGDMAEQDHSCWHCKKPDCILPSCKAADCCENDAIGCKIPKCNCCSCDCSVCLRPKCVSKNSIRPHLRTFQGCVQVFVPAVSTIRFFHVFWLFSVKIPCTGFADSFLEILYESIFV